MAIDVETKDCTALSDSELEELANLSAEHPYHFDIGVVSKQRDSWVLCTMARDGSKLKGFAFCTLERIGGTPCVLIGLASIARTTKRDSVLKALMTDLFRRAVLAFPDEDVLVGTRFSNAGGYEAFRTLHDIVPRPDHKASGEERAWGRRLCKRFGIDAGNYDDRAFIAKGDGNPPVVFDHESLKPDKIDPAFAAFFKTMKPKKGDVLIAFGWAKAEDLDRLMPPA
jgi:hypothetical protein